MSERIIEGAGKLFMQYGIRSVTMDDIARYLSISKKTIYQFVRDKDEIVSLVVLKKIEEEKHQFTDIENDSTDAIEELSSVSVCLRQIVTDINPSLLFDLKKYHPKAWKLYMDYKEDFIFNYITRNLENGVLEGFFRTDIDVKTLARLRVEQVQMAFDDTIYPRAKYNFKDVQMQLFNHFVYGIVTEKGKEAYENYLLKSTENNR